VTKARSERFLKSGLYIFCFSRPTFSFQLSRSRATPLKVLVSTYCFTKPPAFISRITHPVARIFFMGYNPFSVFQRLFSFTTQTRSARIPFGSVMSPAGFRLQGNLSANRGNLKCHHCRLGSIGAHRGCNNPFCSHRSIGGFSVRFPRVTGNSWQE
jgi:hypothetical protein